MTNKLRDGKVFNEEGKIIFFSPEKFHQDIILGNKCFICGVSKKDATFNKEHIIPRWIQDDFKMFNEKITLSNNNRHKYSTYRIPCCSACNSRMGKEIEEPISKLIRSGYTEVVNFIEENGPELFYSWLARIFLKTHIKDRSLKKSINKREAGNLGDGYKWEDFHFIHHLSRTFYTGLKITPNIMGSLFVLPLEDRVNGNLNMFYYCDYTEAQILILQINKIGFIALFNDFGIANHNLEKTFQKINGRPLNPAQLVEIAALATVINFSYQNKPTILFDPTTCKFLTLIPEKTKFNKVSEKDFGKTFSYLARNMINDEGLKNKIKNGERTFLWNEDGSFNDKHL